MDENLITQPTITTAPMCPKHIYNDNINQNGNYKVNTTENIVFSVNMPRYSYPCTQINVF